MHTKCHRKYWWLCSHFKVIATFIAVIYSQFVMVHALFSPNYKLNIAGNVSDIPFCVYVYSSNKKETQTNEQWNYNKDVKWLSNLSLLMPFLHKLIVQHSIESIPTFIFRLVPAPRNVFPVCHISRFQFVQTKNKTETGTFHIHALIDTDIFKFYCWIIFKLSKRIIASKRGFFSPLSAYVLYVIWQWLFISGCCTCVDFVHFTVTYTGPSTKRVPFYLHIPGKCLAVNWEIG